MPCEPYDDHQRLIAAVADKSLEHLGRPPGPSRSSAGANNRGDADEKASAQRTPAWASVSVLVGAECPLTGWEDELRRLGGGQGLPGGFIDT
jgi:hypothetical protein